MTHLSRTVPAGAHHRLIEHYGPSVRPWLAAVDNTIATTATKHNITIAGFHDAGWTSVVAVGHQPSGRAVMLKAFVDADRYAHERAALTHWNGYSTCRLVARDDPNTTLITELIGAAAGGAPRPADDTERVADALAHLHRLDVEHPTIVPSLHDYYRDTVLPAITRRARRFGHVLGNHVIRRALDVGSDLAASPPQSAMLHADLYAENVLFHIDDQPVFIDPHPKIGTPAFDWAFWCVYYRQDGHFSTRVDLCRQRLDGSIEEVIAWALTLAVSGALYYLDSGNPDADHMRAVLASADLSSLLR